MMRVQRDPAASARLHLRLIETPAEDFRSYFSGRVPTPAEKAAFVEQEVKAIAAEPVYENDVYQVEVSETPPFVCLTVRRLDGQPCADWADLQELKNELVGPENEAVRRFPAEGEDFEVPGECRLWVHRDPSFRFSTGLVAQALLVPGGAPAIAAAQGS